MTPSGGHKLIPGVVGYLGTALENILKPGVIKTAATLLFAVTILAVAISALVKPEHNWDMVPYIAVAMENEIADPAELHARTWAIMEDAAKPSHLHTLTKGNEYNIAQYENADYFYSQLGMYRVKYGYTQSLRLLGPLIGYVEATQLINAVSVLIIGLVLLLWLRRFEATESALLLAPYMLGIGFLSNAQNATPDMMTIALFLVGLYLFRTDRDWLAVPFILLAFLVRPDGLIFIFALLLAVIFLGGRILPVACTFCVALGSYFLIAKGAGHPGWWPHFVFSNVEIQNDMAGFDPAFSIKTYLIALVRGVAVALSNNVWLAVSAILLLGWIVMRRADKEPRGTAATLFLALVLCVGGKFVTFPLPDDRVYFLYILLAAVLLLESWKPKFDLARKSN